jgi:GntR family transcriptional regulator
MVAKPLVLLPFRGKCVDAPLVRSPVYQQLNEQLRGLLRREFAPGEQFLTERRVGERFQVSRATANKALASLVSEGLLEFRKGVGTFVRGGPIDYDLRSLISFTEKARAAGRTPSTQVRSFVKVEARRSPPEVQAALRVQPDAPLWHLVRLRLADDVPVILEDRFVDAVRCPRLTRRQANGSLYQAWTETHGLQLAGATETIRAIGLPPDEAGLLSVAVGSPAFEVVSTGLLEGGEPLWRERTLYRGDAYEFRNRLGPVRAASSTIGALRNQP